MPTKKTSTLEKHDDSEAAQGFDERKKSRSAADISAYRREDGCQHCIFDQGWHVAASRMSSADPQFCSHTLQQKKSWKISCCFRRWHHQQAMGLQSLSSFVPVNVVSEGMIFVSVAVQRDDNDRREQIPTALFRWSQDNNSSSETCLC